MRNMATFLIAVTLVGAIPSIVTADPAEPYGFDCLKSIDLWEQGQGKWAITNGVFRHESAGVAQMAILKTDGVPIPSWYDVTVVAEGLDKAQDKRISIVFGYHSQDEYWVCTYEQGEMQAHVRVQRMLRGVPDISVDTPLVRDPSDRVILQLQVRHAEATYMTALVDHRAIVSFTHPEELPRRCGVLVHSSNVTINKYTMSGIARR